MPLIQKNAVECGYTVLYRFDPRNEKPLTIDSREPKWDKFNSFLMNEGRYFNLVKIRGEEMANQLFAKACHDAQTRYVKLKAKKRMQDEQ